jgi:conserved oligomeric Golgi complex subunit 6
MRRKVVVKDFLEALTQGENALSARAIDIQAHDPLRYLGDILAWTHQAVAGEKEILTLIFGVAVSSRSSDFEPGSERWLEDGTIISALEDLVEKDLEGTIRPIRVCAGLTYSLNLSLGLSTLLLLKKILLFSLGSVCC